MIELPTEPLSFEKFWAMYQASSAETDRQMKETDRKIQEVAERNKEVAESQKETSKLIKEVGEKQKETDRLMKETDRKMKETAEQMKETDIKIGKLGNRFGDVIEHLVAPGIADKFNELGFQFTREALNAKFKDPQTLKVVAEVDVFLENGDIVIALEVKSKLRTEDVNEHLERMEVLRRLADLRGDKRKYRGGIAAAVTTDTARMYALKSGFYVLEQSGDTMKLELPEGFVARDW